MSARDRRARSVPRSTPPRSEAPPALTLPPAPALAALAALALLLVLAPPAHNAFWGVNAVRSLPLVWLVALLALAVGAAGLAARTARSGAIVAAMAPVLAALLAFPLREKLHVLGDSSVRWGAIGSYALGLRTDLAEWASGLHAQPLDLLVAVPLTAAISHAMPSVEIALSLVSLVLALGYLGGLWAAVRALTPDASARVPLWLAVTLAGTLLAFAGYPESAGLLLAAAAWWWAALLAPLDRPRAVAALLAAWALVWVSHRLAFVLLVPMLVRTLGPAHVGDQPGARRAAAVGILGVGALAMLATLAAGTRLGGDFAQLMAGPARDTLPSVPFDLINLLLFSAPLVVIAALAAGGRAWRTFAADPRAWTFAAAIVPLLPMAFPVPVLGNGLGIQRDWDLAALPAQSLTLAGAAVFAGCERERRRGVLALAAPLLAVLALGGVMVNAHEATARARVEAMAEGRPALGRDQRASVLLWLGGDRLVRGDAAGAARALEQSWDLVPTPARGTRSALAWLTAGDPAAALRMVDAVRARGGLDATTAPVVDSLASRARVLLSQSGAVTPARSNEPTGAPDTARPEGPK